MKNENGSPAALPEHYPILGRLIDIKRELDERKALFAEFDELIIALAESNFKSAEIDGMVLTLKDNFAEGNTGWSAAAVKRFDLDIITKELALKRAVRKTE